MAIESINPTTGEHIQIYDEMTDDQIETIVAQSHHAFLVWRRTEIAVRAIAMRAAARILRERAAEYGILMTQEMGKTSKDGKAEAEKCAWVCEYYADNAKTFLTPETVETDARKSFVTFQPLGVVLAVMPWNFPFWQVFRFAAPALMAGNGAILKHASNVPGCALAIEDIFREAGFPEHLFRSLLISGRKVDIVIEHPHVRAVTLTGSTPAGKSVARKAGHMIKKTVLELGGNDPYIILEDANLDAAAAACTTSRLINAGQSCIAAKRFIVVDPVRVEFERLFVERMKAHIMGNPMNPTTTLGPLARHDLRDELHDQVLRSIGKGAVCLLGGEVPADKGAFYPATVLTRVTKGMPAYDEELFGPVAAIIAAHDEREAIEIANDSIFGLGAAVFTRTIEKGERIAAEELEAGCCFVNSFVKSDPRLPFGGVRESGYGRELSHYGIKEFVNIKTVFIT